MSIFFCSTEYTSHDASVNTFRVQSDNGSLARLAAFSKKLHNFKAAIALNVAYYNLVKTHGTLRMTPAQAAGIESSAWTVGDLVDAA